MKGIAVGTESAAIVDDADWALLTSYRWNLSGSGVGYGSYAATREYPGRVGKTTYMHRVIVGAERGVEVDHINGDTLDNRRCNLRLVDHTQNMQNRRGAAKHSATGIRGVYWSAQKQRYGVKIKVRKKDIHIGFYKEKESAHKAASEARRLYMTHSVDQEVDDGHAYRVVENDKRRWGKGIALHVAEDDWTLCGHAFTQPAWRESIKDVGEVGCVRCLQILVRRRWLLNQIA